jgi:uncharacterized protein (TIGR03435 family)
MRLVRLLSILALVMSAAPCQSNGSDQGTFEVVSVKPAVPAAGRGGKGGGRGINDPVLFSVRSRTLKNLIRMAYDLEDYQLTGGPAWIDSDAFDVDARPAKPATRAEMLPLLRGLLADRFQLVVHNESRPMLVNVLSVAEGGPKFGPQFRKTDPSVPLVPVQNKNGELPLGGPMKQVAQMIGANMRLFDPEVGGVYRPDLPPVIDQTGLEGEYDVLLNTSTHEDWATMLERQLGLKLDLRKVPIDILVIDRAAKPSAN